MTDCSRDSLTFSRLGAKAVVADFQGGRLTTDAGALLLRQVERRLGLFDALDAAIPDPRRPELIEHDQKALLAQRITAIALGYEDLNDHQTLRADPALQVVAGRDPAPEATLASPSTLCRLENRVDRATLARIAGVLVDQFIAAHPEPPEALILDFDATDDPVHGHQEGRFFHGDYDHHCFLPLYVFCGDELLTAYLRPANIDAAKHARAVLKLLVDRLRAAWPQVRITLRADSGFCRWRLMRWCDRNGIGDVLTAACVLGGSRVGAATAMTSSPPVRIAGGGRSMRLRRKSSAGSSVSMLTAARRWRLPAGSTASALQRHGVASGTPPRSMAAASGSMAPSTTGSTSGKSSTTGSDSSRIL